MAEKHRLNRSFLSKCSEISKICTKIPKICGFPIENKGAEHSGTTHKPYEMYINFPCQIKKLPDKGNIKKRPLRLKLLGLENRSHRREVGERCEKGKKATNKLGETVLSGGGT